MRLATAPEGIDLALVSMPFGPLFLPSIGLGLLKAGIETRGIRVKDFYFTFSMAERIGTHLYLEISNGTHSTCDLLGEWIFSSSLFGPDADRENEYIDSVLKGGSPAHRKDGCYEISFSGLTQERIDHLVSLRNQDEFLDHCLERILSYRPAIVGFTSVFQQQLASLALAKRLKARAPEIMLLMGGANCEGVMGVEIVKQFPFIDAVVSGEGDLVAPELVEAILEKRPVAHLPGVHTRASVRSPFPTGKPASASPVTEMNSLPIPDYDGYFEQYEASRKKLSDVYTPHILFETSRGCYWGKVSHCTFCGLNGESMAFRSKSAGSRSG